MTAVGVASDGGVGANLPGVDPNADGEVMLDIEVAGAVAPKAKIAVYFALNTDNGFLAAVNTALHDSVRKPSVISISWGSTEELNTPQALRAFNLVLEDAAALGVTVCCSSGDDGSSDIRKPSERDGKPHVDFPASSPFALACGGTMLLGSGTAIASEVVWNQGNGGTGGGVSNFFARPRYQAKAKVPKSPKGKVGRGVPDVAGDADPNTGYQVRLVGGKKEVIGGTSAVSPLWAGLIALVNQKLAKLGKPAVGFVNPVLFKVHPASGVFHDIVTGTNDIEGLGRSKAAQGLGRLHRAGYARRREAARRSGWVTGATRHAPSERRVDCVQHERVLCTVSFDCRQFGRYRSCQPPYEICCVASPTFTPSGRATRSTTPSA